MSKLLRFPGQSHTIYLESVDYGLRAMGIGFAPAVFQRQHAAQVVPSERKWDVPAQRMGWWDQVIGRAGRQKLSGKVALGYSAHTEALGGSTASLRSRKGQNLLLTRFAVPTEGRGLNPAEKRSLRDFRNEP